MNNINGFGSSNFNHEYLPSSGSKRTREEDEELSKENKVPKAYATESVHTTTSSSTSILEAMDVQPELSSLESEFFTKLYKLNDDTQTESIKELIAEYLKLGINPNAVIPYGSLKGATIALMIAKEDNFDLFNEAYEKDPTLDVNARTVSNNKSPIWWLAFYGRWEIVKKCCSKISEETLNAAPTNPFSVGPTILWLAAHQKQWDLLNDWIDAYSYLDFNAICQRAFEWLREAGPEVDAGMSVLDLLFKAEKWDLIDKIFKKYPVDAEKCCLSIDNKTPLLWIAVKAQKWEIVYLLLIAHPNLDVNSKLLGTGAQDDASILELVEQCGDPSIKNRLLAVIILKGHEVAGEGICNNDYFKANWNLHLNPFNASTLSMNERWEQFYETIRKERPELNDLPNALIDAYMKKKHVFWKKELSDEAKRTIATRYFKLYHDVLAVNYSALQKKDILNLIYECLEISENTHPDLLFNVTLSNSIVEKLGSLADFKPKIIQQAIEECISEAANTPKIEVDGVVESNAHKANSSQPHITSTDKQEPVEMSVLWKIVKEKDWKNVLNQLIQHPKLDVHFKPQDALNGPTILEMIYDCEYQFWYKALLIVLILKNIEIDEIGVGVSDCFKKNWKLFFNPFEESNQLYKPDQRWSKLNLAVVSELPELAYIYDSSTPARLLLKDYLNNKNRIWKKELNDEAKDLIAKGCVKKYIQSRDVFANNYSEDQRKEAYELVLECLENAGNKDPDLVFTKALSKRIKTTVGNLTDFKFTPIQQAIEECIQSQDIDLQNSAKQKIVQESYATYEKFRGAPASDWRRVVESCLNNAETNHPNLLFIPELATSLIENISNAADFTQDTIGKIIEECIAKNNFINTDSKLKITPLPKITPPPPSGLPKENVKMEWTFSANPTKEEEFFKKTNDIMKEREFTSEEDRKNLRNLFESFPKLDPNAVMPYGIFEGASICWLAAYAGKFDFVEKYSESNVLTDINASPKFGFKAGITIGWFLAYAKQWALLAKLHDNYFELDMNACPKQGSYAGISILWLVVGWSQSTIFDKVLARRREINPNSAPLIGQDEGLTIGIYLALQTKWEHLQALIQKCPHIDLNAIQKDSRLKVSLAWIIASSNIELFEKIIGSFPKVDLNLKNKSNMSLLCLLAKKGKLNLVEGFLNGSSGLDINAKVTRTKHDFNRAHENYKRDEGTNVVYHACFHDDWKHVREILKHYPHADFNAAPSYGPLIGMSALWMAAAADQWDIVFNALISNPEPNLQAKPPQNLTSLKAKFSVLDLILNINDKIEKNKLLAVLALKGLINDQPIVKALDQVMKDYYTTHLSEFRESNFDLLPVEIRGGPVLRAHLRNKFPEMKAIPDSLLDTFISGYRKKQMKEERDFAKRIIELGSVKGYRRNKDITTKSYSENQIRDARLLVRSCLKKAERNYQNILFTHPLRTSIIDKISNASDFKRSTIEKAIDVSIQKELAKRAIVDKIIKMTLANKEATAAKLSNSQVLDASELIKSCLDETEKKKDLIFAESLCQLIIDKIVKNPDFKREAIEIAIEESIQEHLTQLKSDSLGSPS